MLLNGAAQIEETATQLAERLRNSTSSKCIMPIFSKVRCRVISQCPLFYNALLKVARKVDEAANSVFVKLTEQTPPILCSAGQNRFGLGKAFHMRVRRLDSG
jgi:hypothetical protein